MDVLRCHEIGHEHLASLLARYGLDITLVADRDMVTDLEVLADRLEIELDFLHHECATLAAS